jgi:hypothetical protein
MQVTSPDWSVAIFAARESTETLCQCIRAALAASRGHNASIDVLINGNRELALDVGTHDWVGAAGGDGQVRIWSIAVGDKAHAWNEYLHRIWPTGTTAFFIDGYAQVKPDALHALGERLAENDATLGATGVPTCGRSAPRLREQMLKTGGLHGNLHAIRAEAMASMRASAFRLPLGLYRTDSLIGAVLMFGLDPSNNKWDPRRVAVAANASWHVDGLEDITWNNIRTQGRRVLRQAQGDLENRAAREHLAVKRRAPSAMPRTARQLVNDWMEEHPKQARSLFFKRPLCLHAAHKLKAERDWSEAWTAPELVGAVGGAGAASSVTAA